MHFQKPYGRYVHISYIIIRIITFIICTHHVYAIIHERCTCFLLAPPQTGAQRGGWAGRGRGLEIGGMPPFRMTHMTRMSHDSDVT